MKAPAPSSHSSRSKSRGAAAAVPSDAGVRRPTSIFPSLRELTDPAGPYLLPLLLLLVSRMVAWAALPLCSEDAYITFRYAQNLASGHGLVFNPGEHVMGFTSPGWTLWNALGLVIFPRAPLPWARGSSLLADVVTLLLFGRLLALHASRTSAWCFTAFFAAWPYFSAVSMSGMENSAMLMWIALAAALVGSRSALAGVALGMLALWRPEGLASAFVIALGARWRDRITGAAIVALGLGGLTLYFGSPVPQSMLAKARIYGTPGPLSGRAWWDWLIPFQFGGWPTLGETNMLLPLVIILFAGLVASLPRLWKTRTTPLALAIGAGLAVWLGYALTGTAYFFWYLVVPLAAIAAASAVGLPQLLRGWPVYAALALFVLGDWTIAPKLYVGRAQSEYFAFASAGEYLHREAVPGDLAFLEPIGLIGWAAPVRIMDEVGLVSPDVATRRTRGPGWYADVVHDASPRWLVIRRGVRESGDAYAGRGAPFRSSAERDSVFAHYQLATEFDASSGAASLQIWKRVR